MAHCRFEIRGCRRVPVQCTLYYANDEVQGTGNLWNLSLDGCRVDGNIPVRPGMALSLFIMLPGKLVSIIVEQATVTWIRGQEFGLRLEKIQPRDAKRIEKYVIARIS